MSNRSRILIFSVIFSFPLMVLSGIYSQTTDIPYGSASEHSVPSKETDIENCIQKLYHIKSQHFLTSDCCFTKICPNITSISNRHPQIRALLVKLCSEGLHLRETLEGCCIGLNTDTNSSRIFSSIGTAIANCIRERGQINPDVIGDSQQGLLNT